MHLKLVVTMDRCLLPDYITRQSKRHKVTSRQKTNFAIESSLGIIDRLFRQEMFRLSTIKTSTDSTQMAAAAKPVASTPSVFNLESVLPLPKLETSTKNGINDSLQLSPFILTISNYDLQYNVSILTLE